MSDQANHDATHATLEAIQKELALLTQSFRHFQTNQVQAQAALKDILERHDHTLFGNGQVGLTTRTDRLEQAKTMQDKNIGVVWGAICSMAVKLLWDALSRR